MFEETRGATLLDATPFYDTDSFGMLTSTAKRYGVKDIFNVEQNIRGGIRYLGA